MKKIVIGFIVIGYWLSSVHAQSPDSTHSIIQSLKKSKVSGEIKSFYMMTDNVSPLTDYSALAIGGNIKCETGEYYGFKLGAAFYNSSNLGISDVSMTDPYTGKNSRYEAGLFDMTDLKKKYINLLGEAYLGFVHKKNALQIGRIKLTTPFINPQNGRMIPTLVQGVWFENKTFEKLNVQLGFIQGIAPRSTSRWYTVENSLGLYPQGKNVDGTNASYFSNVRSQGVGIMGLSYQIVKPLKLSAWNYYVDNVFNTFYAELAFEKQIQKVNWLLAAQFIQQDKIASGGNEIKNLSYFQFDRSEVYGVRTAVTFRQFKATLNYNRITKEGMFLFPREWGIEPLYTFMKLERTEGTGNIESYTFQLEKKIDWKKSSLHLKTGYGIYRRPDVKDFAMNKYSLPSYDQLNVECEYRFGGLLKGLRLSFLIASKFNKGETYNNLNYVFNRVDMTNYNAIFSYNF